MKERIAAATVPRECTRPTERLDAFMDSLRESFKDRRLRLQSGEFEVVIKRVGEASGEMTR
jgi:hypothetical protein